MSYEQGYNGWKNYPTWCVNLWLSNDEGLYRATLEVVADAKDPELAHTRVSDTLRVDVADALKCWVRDDLTPNLGASFAADLLGYALDCVDWFEIADTWIESASDTADVS